jgi:hypothetical protein
MDPVLQIQTCELFLLLDTNLGSGMEKKSRSGIRDENPQSFFEILETVYRIKNTYIFVAYLDLGSGIFLTLDPG